jgi:hypothetical protein
LEVSISWLPDRRAWPAPHIAQWIGPLVSIIGIAIIAACHFHPAADRSMLARGGITVILSYERALPLLGLGCVLALMRPWQAALGAVAAILGLWAGFAARDWLIAVIVSGPATAARLRLPGPLSCLAAGLILVAPGRVRSWLLPPAAIIIGAMLAIGIELVDPSFHDPNFLIGAIAVSVWLVAAVGLTGHLCNLLGFRIALRIVGSWLIAIGLMLGAAILLPRHTIGDGPQQLPERFERPGFPDTDRSPPRAGRPQPPSGPSDFDPSRQL